MSIRIRGLAAASLLLALSSSSQADLITWGAPQNITSVSELRTNGTLVIARNPWAQSPSSPVVNGITFVGFAPTGWPNGGWTLLNGSTTGDSGYDVLLGTARATGETVQTNPTGWGGIRIDNLGALTLGSTYEIQVWYSDQRPGVPTNVLNDRVMTFSSATGAALLTGGIVTNLAALTQSSSSVALEADPNNTFGAGDTVMGQYAVGSFTRTSSAELWLLIQGSHPLAGNVLRPHINAFQIREVPPVVVTSYCTAGTSTNGCVPAISATGTASVSASAGFTIQVAGLEGQKSGLIFYSVAGRASINWGSGGTSFLCVKAPTQRMTFQSSGGTTGLCDGALAEDWLAWAAAHPAALGQPFAAGTVIDAQAWYRDPPAVKTTNLSDGLEFTLVP